MLGGQFEPTENSENTLLYVEGDFTFSGGNFIQSLKAPGSVTVGGNFIMSNGTYNLEELPGRFLSAVILSSRAIFTWAPRNIL